ncbi:MAG: metal-dependent hydrolase [Chloroflexi bacterium]|nr:metal-dependent hydrolase [Chloroflexota bacterium]
MSAQQSKSGVQVTWLGHSAFKLVSPEGKVVLIDPFLANPKCPAEYKDASKVKADFICVTHDHVDHLGDALAIAKNTGARIVAVTDVGRSIIEQGIEGSKVSAFHVGGTVKVDNLSFSLVKAFHSSAHGVPVGVIVGFSSGFKVYHAGDTEIFGDMAFVRRLYQPDLALVPIGGFYTMDAKAASIACRELIQAQHVIPMHYGTMPVLAPDADEFKQLMMGSNIQVITPQPGDTVTF